MNRIIIIGNGFDLAHNLKTGYKDFINDYWDTVEELFPAGMLKKMLKKGFMINTGGC